VRPNRLAGLVSWLLLVPTGASPSVGPVDPATVYAHAHAHNDYLNDQPLTGALGHGFTSVEADVWLDGGALVLCHAMRGETCYDDTPGSLGGPRVMPKRRLEDSYLAPLLSQVGTAGGQVYPGYSGRFLLLIEIKCKREEQPVCPADQPVDTWRAIEQQLSRFQSEYHGPGQLFTGYRHGEKHPGAVQVVITGGYNSQQGTAGDSVRDHIDDPSSTRIAALDGGASDVTTATPTAVTPLISLGWSGATDGGCVGGGLTTAQLAAVRAAHDGNYLVRIWGEPDCPRRADHTTDPAKLAAYQRGREAAWTAIHQLSDTRGNPAVDYISSDHESYLPTWLSAVGWVK